MRYSLWPLNWPDEKGGDLKNVLSEEVSPPEIGLSSFRLSAWGLPARLMKESYKSTSTYEYEYIGTDAIWPVRLN